MNMYIVFGDQLNQEISSLKNVNKSKDIVCLFEVMDETQYVKHHKKKIAFIFSAMRHFAKDLKTSGFHVEYVTLDAPQNTGSFENEIKRMVDQFNPVKVIMTEPSEYRVLQSVQSLDLSVPVEIREDDRFLCSHASFESWSKGRKELRMEYFYREMRKKYHVLTEGDKPIGGKWNFDKENRKPPKTGLDIPKTFFEEPDEITCEVLSLVENEFDHHFGDLYPFYFAVTREQALCALDLFIRERLPSFGDYQDAMIENEPWMYHSHISFYLNTGLLLPLECIEVAQQAYVEQTAPLNAVEGFIRQVLGWREYVRGIYWLYMPEYYERNHLAASHDLPELFWGKPTKMNCLAQCVKETKQNAYAHHIQRLMVLGNFALIAGLAPKQVNEWYLIVYADAFEWVELPNVSGMVLFADGGILGSKPYASSGAYIHKMSDYCANCEYKVNKKNGEDACPFNYLYWDFLLRNKSKLRGNQRLSMIYNTLERMSEEKIMMIENDSQRFLNAMNNDEEI